VFKTLNISTCRIRRIQLGERRRNNKYFFLKGNYFLQK
jgi:hypothetical protein